MREFLINTKLKEVTCGPDRLMPSVLIVDDNPLVARATARALRGVGWRAGHNTTLAGMEEEPRPDAIVCDWEPYGPTVINQIKGVPIVVFTGNPVQARQDLAGMGRPDIRVLVKDGDVMKLSSAICDLFEQSAEATA